MSISTINTTTRPTTTPINSATRPTTTTTAATKGHGNAQACAACKYQRRKCAADCLLAPYFPHDSQRQFLNAHRLFGVSNITKIIKHLHDPRSKDDAMRTIIFQSDARASDPVGGCHRIIRELHRQIDLAKAELDFVMHHLAICRAAAAAQPPPGSLEAGDQVDGLAMQESFHFLQPESVVVPMQQYQDDVSSWVVQDSSDLKADAVDVDVNVNVNVDFKPFHRRDEAMLRPAAVTDDATAVLKEEDFSIQHEDDDLRNAATMFSLTHCSS